jgi:hypothetical protein
MSRPAGGSTESTARSPAFEPGQNIPFQILLFRLPTRQLFLSIFITAAPSIQYNIESRRQNTESFEMFFSRS